MAHTAARELERVISLATVRVLALVLKHKVDLPQGNQKTASIRHGPSSGHSVPTTSVLLLRVPAPERVIHQHVEEETASGPASRQTLVRLYPEEMVLSQRGPTSGRSTPMTFVPPRLALAQGLVTRRCVEVGIVLGLLSTPILVKPYHVRTGFSIPGQSSDHSVTATLAKQLLARAHDPVTRPYAVEPTVKVPPSTVMHVQPILRQMVNGLTLPGQPGHWIVTLVRGDAQVPCKPLSTSIDIFLQELERVRCLHRGVMASCVKGRARPRKLCPSKVPCCNLSAVFTSSSRANRDVERMDMECLGTFLWQPDEAWKADLR